MSSYYSHVYAEAPDFIPVPEELRGQGVQVILLPVGSDGKSLAGQKTDALGWPEGFFERTFGAVPELDEVERSSQYEEREDFE